MSDLTFKTASELSALLAEGELSSVELTQACLAHIEATEPKVASFNSVDKAHALSQANASDARRADDKVLGPLDGIPVALKDVIAEQNQPLTASSKMLANFVSPYDAHVTELLKGQGAVSLGRCNLDEFAMGSSTENSGFAPSKNPFNTACVPGGSSGGSAACVAAGEVPLSLGSDTGGSIRQPAAFCGVVGMKPTYGLVSRYGLIAFASSLDQIGPFAHTVEDAALLLDAIMGHDRRDSTSLTVEPPKCHDAVKNAGGQSFRVGVPKEYFGEGLSAEVKESVQKAIDWYAANGHEVVEVSLPTTELAVPVYYIIAPAEASSNLSRYDGIRYGHRAKDFNDAIDLYFQSRAEGFGPEVKRRIILGTYALSSGYYDAFYLKAQKVRTLIRRDFESAFAKCDVLLTPTTPTPAFKFGDKADDPLAMYLSDIFTINVNLAGIPGISLPCGFSSEGLPIGMQIIGPAFGEEKLFAAAHLYEQAHDWAKLHPRV